MIDFIFWSALLLSGFYFIFLVISSYRAFYLYKIKLQPEEFKGISILKPLKGLDDRLEENLESFFKLEYPEFELLFGVADKDDPAIPLVKKLQKKHSHISSKLVINRHRIGLNPKINNLFNLYPSAKFQHLLISDSNIRVHPEYLKNLMSTLNLPQTGLATSAIRGMGAQGIGSIFENLHLNAFITPSVPAVKSLINLPISIGKSMLFKRDTLEKIGGFSAFQDILAEDHLMGIAVRDLGLEVRNCPHLIDNINENWQVKNFINRHLRWAKLRKNTHELYYLIELLSNPIPIALVYAIIRFDTFGLTIFLLATFMKTTIDVIINKMMRSDLKWYHFSLIPVKDMVIGSIWFIPYFSNTVNWRGNRFRIGKNTQLIPISKG